MTMNGTADLDDIDKTLAYLAGLFRTLDGRCRADVEPTHSRYRAGVDMQLI